MRWRLYIEEYSPDLQYIKGENNVVADALSRLEMTTSKSEDTTEIYYSVMQCFAKLKTKSLKTSIFILYLILILIKHNTLLLRSRKS